MLKRIKPPVLDIQRLSRTEYRRKLKDYTEDFSTDLSEEIAEELFSGGHRRINVIRKRKFNDRDES
jgi:hypothetical protein